MCSCVHNAFLLGRGHHLGRELRLWHDCEQDHNRCCQIQVTCNTSCLGKLLRRYMSAVGKIAHHGLHHNGLPSARHTDDFNTNQQQMLPNSKEVSSPYHCLSWHETRKQCKTEIKRSAKTPHLKGFCGAYHVVSYG